MRGLYHYHIIIWIAWSWTCVGKSKRRKQIGTRDRTGAITPLIHFSQGKNIASWQNRWLIGQLPRLLWRGVGRVGQLNGTCLEHLGIGLLKNCYKPRDFQEKKSSLILLFSALSVFVG